MKLMPAEKKLLARCRSLQYHPRLSLREELKTLSLDAAKHGDRDFYGRGELIESFELRIAKLLGKPAAIFLPTGVLALQIALRIGADRSGNRRFGVHPLSHVMVHEHDAYRFPHRLKPVLAGKWTETPSVRHLNEIKVPLSSFLLELPQRELGGAAPTLSEIALLSKLAKKRKIQFVLDGARLWEVQPFYSVPLKKITAYFDTVYVSFYKGLGGISGAALCGDSNFIREARIWQRRLGGNPISLYPYVLSAAAGLNKFLPQMKLYHQKAIEVAKVVAAIPGFKVAPFPIAANCFHIEFEAIESHLWKANLAVARQTGIALFTNFWKNPKRSKGVIEVTIGENCLTLTLSEIREAFELLARLSRSNRK